MSEKIVRALLIEDVREMTEILETVHPDPYINGGGKIAFHRRLQLLIRNIHGEGLTKQEFLDLIQPFVAALKDAHTNILPSGISRNFQNPGGIPLFFDPIEEKLCVRAVTKNEYLSFIGCILESVEGFSFSEIIERQKTRMGYDSYYSLLERLGRTYTLYFGSMLKALLPEWKNEKEISFTLKYPDGSSKNHTLPIAMNVQYPLQFGETKKKILETKDWIAYDFIDEQKESAYFKINSMSTYREAFELWHSKGQTNFHISLKRVYSLYNSGDIPESIEEIISKIPSATNLLISLFTEMKEAQTKNLIIDLRLCEGGYDIIIAFILYFLIGFEEFLKLQVKRGETQKLSEFIHKSGEKGLEPENIPYYNEVPLTWNDYSFAFDPQFVNEEKLLEIFRKNFLDEIEKTSFYKIFKNKEYENYYKPNNIVVLCSSGTTSSAFDLMNNLKKINAIVVGVQSGQIGNNFGNVRRFQLKNSELTGYISTKYFVAFPECLSSESVIKPDYELTYAKLKEYNFDKNAELLFALDIINKKK
ncbi:MAG: hypothetical protein EAX90_15055 [Candidatus Heimdallarchaeota archaeon]|nr:hypothetical protein [Candidatus Heimdallarchaeota archaeon]